MHVVDKATKLETIFDRIQLIDTRFEVLKRDAEIESLQASSTLARTTMEQPSDDAQLRERCAQLDDDRKFLHACNIGGERMRDEDIERVQRIAALPLARRRGPRGATSSPTTR